MQDVYEYLFLVTKIRALEPTLLNQEHIARMLDARNDSDALAVLSECGYSDFSDSSAETIDKVLGEARLKMMNEIGNYIPSPEIRDVFRIPYDYHNVKVLLKSDAMDVDPTPLLLDLGTVPAKELESRVRTNNLGSLDYILRVAIADAQETLATTGDPQLADLVLDRAYFAQLTVLAEQSGSEFLQEYVRLQIDAANLRIAIRTLRMGQNVEFLRDVFLIGGNISETRMFNAATGGTLVDLFSLSIFKHAAEAGVSALAGGRLTAFEKLCDDALNEFLRVAKFIVVGEQPVIAYIAARESEMTAIRIIFTGRRGKLDPETIKERLRETYV